MKLKLLQERITGSTHWRCIRFFLTVITVYLLLFEFILSVPNFFPAPSLILDSLFYLSEKFNIFASLAILWGVIFAGMLIAMTLVYLLRKFFLPFADRFPNFFVPFRIFLFFTPLGLLLFWNIFFTESWLIDFLFVLVVSISILLFEISKAMSSRNVAYELAAKGLGKPNDEVYSKVVWKAILPELKNSISPLHIKLWSYLLISQFISGFSLGGLFRELFKYQDVAGIYALALVIWVAIHLNEVFWYYVSNKIIFYES